MRRRFIKTTSSKLLQFDINNYITIEALEDNLTIEVGIYNGRAYYSIDGIGWNEYEPNSEILLNKGQTISFKGTNVKAQFYIDKPCNILGNGYSLLVGDDAVNITDISSFGNSILSFSSCPIINVASSFLPATTLAIGCYENMFYNCASLTTAPELPAINLAKECYLNMFYGCSRLKIAPELPATEIALECYYQMFKNCSSLTTAPTVLPATTLANGCYQSMFYGCTSLTTAPELPATVLTPTCYEAMFYGCTKLNYIKMLAINIFASNCLNNWVYGIASTGTFVKNPNAPWEVYGNNGIPNGWKVVMDGEESGESSLTFPVTLVEGDNGQLGIDVYNYLFEKYSVGVNFTEELYFKGTSYSVFDGRIMQIIIVSPNSLTLTLQNHLNVANIYLYSNGVVALNIYG